MHKYNYKTILNQNQWIISKARDHHLRRSKTFRLFILRKMPALRINKTLILEIQMKFLIKSSSFLPLKSNHFDLRHSNTIIKKSKFPSEVQRYLMR